MSNEPYVTHKMIRDWAAENVNLKEASVKQFREQLGRLETRLKSYIDEHPDYGFVKARRSGSVPKGTALKTVNDMDLAVYVEETKAPGTDSALLSWMEARLKEALQPLGLKDAQFRQEAHCVTVSYQGSGLKVDVVPVLYEGEADDVGYLITDTGARVETSVTRHLTFIRSRKGPSPSDYAQLVRLTKWWVRRLKQLDDDFRFKSFMVELIWAHLVDQQLDLTDYPSALEEFFTYIVRTELKQRISFSDFYEASEMPDPTGAAIEIFDPVNPENNVAATYTEAQRVAIVEAANDALDALSAAAYVEKKGRAVELWKKVLGPGFNG